MSSENPRVLLTASDICAAQSCLERAVPLRRYCWAHLKQGTEAALKRARSGLNERLTKKALGSRRFLYAMRCQEFVKFGIAENIARRHAIHQISCPFEIEVIGAAAVPTIYESLVHQHLKACHVRGEWFRICPESQAVIDLLIAGDGDALMDLVSN